MMTTQSMSGGKGGCTVASNGPPELTLPLAVLWAVVAISRRYRAGRLRKQNQPAATA